jgi:hypothetical protein
MSKQYDLTYYSVKHWADDALQHVGYLLATKDRDLQYSYAQSTVNGMLHLRDALFQMVNNSEYAHHKTDLLRIHDEVVRVIKHLVRDFNVDLDAIKKFNTRHVLSNLSYLKNSGTRKNRRTRKYRS